MRKTEQLFDTETAVQKLENLDDFMDLGGGWTCHFF